MSKLTENNFHVKCLVKLVATGRRIRFCAFVNPAITTKATNAQCIWNLQTILNFVKSWHTALCKSPEIQCVELTFPHHFVTFYPTTILLINRFVKLNGFLKLGIDFHTGYLMLKRSFFED